MALSHKTKGRWALMILLIGLPLYIVAAVSLLTLFDRPPLWLEFGIYGVLGILWALPFRFIFRGVGKADESAEE